MWISTSFRRLAHVVEGIYAVTFGTAEEELVQWFRHLLQLLDLSAIAIFPSVSYRAESILRGAIIHE